MTHGDDIPFYERYSENLSHYKAFATAVSDYLREALQDAGLEVHAVFARAKDPEGLLDKLRRKDYIDPDTEVTDLVGARIITHYSDEVDNVASFVRRSLSHVDMNRSVDKRTALTDKEFGYRSVHVIGALPNDYLNIKGLATSPPFLFEVQVRSILEHAWAQIEHEIVYKSGVVYPEEFKRRFHAIAGTLEILDREFIALRHYRDELVEQHKDRYKSFAELTMSFDAARLVAFLEVTREAGLGWRKAEKLGAPFARHSESTCVAVLRAAGLSTPQELLTWLNDDICLTAIERFAAGTGQTPADCPHYELALLAAGAKAPLVLSSFPDVYGREVIAALEPEEPEEAEEHVIGDAAQE